MKKLLEDNIKVHEIKSYNKYGKRETGQKVKKGNIINKIWKIYK